MARIKRARGWVNLHHAEVCFKGRAKNVIRAANIVIPPSGNNVRVDRYYWSIPKRTNHKLYLIVSREICRSVDSNLPTTANSCISMNGFGRRRTDTNQHSMSHNLGSKVLTAMRPEKAPAIEYIPLL
jgi:hypothetical protein